MKKIAMLLLLLLCFTSFSQINYEPGYFLDNNGTKTECLIRNVAWKNNPTEFEYKISESDNSQKKNIADVSEFNISDRYKYKRFTVNIDKSGRSVDNMSSQKQPEWKEETLFLKSLTEGEINLYMYESDAYIRFFYSIGDHSKAEQLVFKEYLSGSSQISQNNYFRQQLLMIMKSPKLTLKDFEQLSYKKKDLVAIFQKYNENGNTTFSNYESKQNNGEVNLKIIAGVSNSSIDVDNYFSGADFNFESQLLFKVGIEVEGILPFNQNKWSLFMAPTYQSFEAEGKKNNSITKADYTFVELPIGVRHYMFLSDKSKLFINAGYMFALNGDSFVSYGSSKVNISKSTNYFAGIGFTHKPFNIEARYNFDRGILQPNSAWQATYNSVGILFGYTLF